MDSVLKKGLFLVTISSLVMGISPGSTGCGYRFCFTRCRDRGSFE